MKSNSTGKVIVITVEGGEQDTNGDYYLTEESYNAAPVYSKTGICRNPDDNSVIIYKHDSKWKIGRNKLKPNTFIYYSYTNNKRSIPGETDWRFERYVYGGKSSFNVKVDHVQIYKVQPSKAWESMLLSPKFSDIQFHCPDRSILHAHKNILAASSPYFAIVFEGPWDDEHPDGIWKTTNDTDIMKIVLKSMYTGFRNLKKVMTRPLDVLALAHEYELKDLVNMIEVILIEDITHENVRETLLVSSLYDLKDLKVSCFEYIRKYPLRTLTNIDFAKLSSTNEELWMELDTHLSSNS